MARYLGCSVEFRRTRVGANVKRNSTNEAKKLNITFSSLTLATGPQNAVSTRQAVCLPCLPSPKRGGGVPVTLFSRKGSASKSKQASLIAQEMCLQPSYRYRINYQELPNPILPNPTRPSLPDPTDRLMEKYGVSLQFLPCPTVHPFPCPVSCFRRAIHRFISPQLLVSHAK